MYSSPIAFFISFTTYGVWLHGRAKGSIDKEHNEYGTPFLASDESLEKEMQCNLRGDKYILDVRRRQVVLDTILEVAKHRQWKILACHVRTTHVHVVVVADANPEKVLSDFKAYASRRLKERLQESADCKRWTQHGSTRYLWHESSVHEAVDYALNRQGDQMAVYDGRSEAQNDAKSEPEA